jgi:hypothetical protein
MGTRFVVTFGRDVWTPFRAWHLRRDVPCDTATGGWARDRVTWAGTGACPYGLRADRNDGTKAYLRCYLK